MWRSRTSKVSGSCQKVSGSWRRLARRYATSSSPERRSTYAHARRTGVTSGGRSTLTPCQNVENEFMTPAATVLHNKPFLRAAVTTYFSVFPRNWASFRPVPRGEIAVAGCVFLGFFLCTCRYFGASLESSGFTSCVTLRAVLFYVS